MLIIGASGFGREVLDLTRVVRSSSRDWAVGGFLDADPAALDGSGVDLPILGDPSTYKPGENDRFICAIGDPATRLGICRQIKYRGGQFITLIHPNVVFGSNSRFGEGCIFCSKSGVTTNVKIGDFVIFNGLAGAVHDVVVGEGCTLSSYCDVTGKATLGEGVLLGSHAVILPGIKVGDYARIGAGSVVVRNVPPGASMFGNPAKQVAGFDPERP